jgi:hypothetical protein
MQPWAGGKGIIEANRIGSSKDRSGELIMRMRFLVGFVAVAALLAPVSLRAGDPKPPTLVIRMKSVDGILQDARYIAKLAGKEDAVQQLDGMLKAFDLGIDQKKPIGIYADLSADGGLPSVVALIPIASEDALLNILTGRLQITPKKGDDGVYTIENVPNVPVPIFLRFDHGYACVTAMDKSNISKAKLLVPSKVLPEDDAVLSIDARLGDIPDQGKQMILLGIDNALNTIKDQKEPNETPAMAKMRIETIDKAGEQIKRIINEGEEFALRIGIDAKKDDIGLDVSFKAKPGSSLAKEMNEGRVKSAFAGLASSEDAIRVIGSVKLPEDSRKAIAPMIDELTKKALDEEKDESKKALLKAGIETIGPTIKAGEINLGAFVRGPDSSGHFTVVGGLKVKDGKGIDEFLRKLYKDMPEKDKGKIALDADSAGDMKIHKISADDMDAEGKKIFGTTDVYLGISDTMVAIGLGPDGLKAVKSASSGSPASSPALDIAVSVARAAGLNKKDENVSKAVKSAFGENPNGNDMITIKAETGERSRFQIHVKGKIITFGVNASGESTDK